MDGLTPYEVFTSCKPNVSHFRVFGCAAHVHVHVPSHKRRSMGAKSKELIFCGYASRAKGFGFGILLWAI